MAIQGVTDLGSFERCRNCNAELSPGTERCPGCGTVVLVPPGGRRNDRKSSVRRNFTHSVIAVLLIIVANLYAPELIRFLPLIGVLRFSPIVTEAVYLASEHKSAVEMLGAPIQIGWVVKGYINDFALSSGESRLRIPVNGSKGNGTLVTRASNGQGPWIFTELNLVSAKGENIDLFDYPPDQRPASVQAKRSVYLVPLGNIKDLGLMDLSKYYREKYGVSVELLAPVPVDVSLREIESGRIIAEEFEGVMKKRHPRLVEDELAVLIGITDEDMFIRDLGPSSMYNFYEVRGRFGLVSTYLLRRPLIPARENPELFRTRIRKLITRNIAIMAFQLPRNSDPTSVLLSRAIGRVSNIDMVFDSFEGAGPRAVVDEYRRAQNETAYEPELLPELSKQEDNTASNYSCLTMKRKPSLGSVSEGYSISFDDCIAKSFLDSEVDEIEIDLRSSRVMSRKTDFFIPGEFPVAATRCYGTWFLAPRTFGGNTALSWDMYPLVNDDPYTKLDMVLCDGSMIRYERISKGTGYIDALYEHRNLGSSFTNSQIKWTSNGWLLRTRDGMNILFPGTQNARRGVDGSMIDFRSSNGHSVGIERDRRRNLKRIIAPNKKSIHFEYDSRYRVVRSFNDSGKIITYGYDVGGRLIEVRSPGVVQQFDYVAEDLTSIRENNQRLLEFRYELGLLRDFSLADGRKFKFRYDRDPKDASIRRRTYLILPDGSVRKLDHARTLASP